MHMSSYDRNDWMQQYIAYASKPFPIEPFLSTTFARKKKHKDISYLIHMSSRWSGLLAEIDFRLSEAPSLL